MYENICKTLSKRKQIEYKSRKSKGLENNKIGVKHKTVRALILLGQFCIWTLLWISEKENTTFSVLNNTSSCGGLILFTTLENIHSISVATKCQNPIFLEKPNIFVNMVHYMENFEN